MDASSSTGKQDDAAESRRQARERARRQKRRAVARARRAREALRQRKTKLEQMGVRYFRKRVDKLPAIDNDDAVHVLNESERRELRRLSRNAISRAFLIGATSAALVASAMIAAAPLKGDDWDEQVGYWAGVAAVAMVTAMGEVAYMYWDSLRTVCRLAHAAGLDVFREADDEAEDAERQAVAAALARAALELPNPPDAVMGVNPQRELSRARIVMITAIYKAKISLTNFAIKAVIRRMIGRAGVRSWLVYLGVPVTASWNAAVSWTVLRQARIRVMGPSAAIEYVSAILDREPPMTRPARLCAMRAVGCAIVSTRDMHPNLRELLAHLKRRLRVKQQADFDDRKVFLASLGELSFDEQTLVLRLLYLAAIIDGRVTGAERRLVADANRVCQRELDPALLGRLRRHFTAGDPAPADLLRRIGPPLGLAEPLNAP